MEFFNAINLNKAKEIVKSNFIPSIIKVKTELALNYVLSKDIISATILPPFNRSTVDGYALKSSDTIGSSEGIPSIFNIIGQIDIGNENKFVLSANTACYVPTGGMLPKNADSVVMIESVETFGDTLLVKKPLSANENVNPKGSDLNVDDIILNKGELLDSRKISYLSSAGIIEVSVISPLSVTIISTGDELVHFSNQLSLGKVWDSNTNILSTLSSENNIKVVNSFLLKDDYKLIKDTILQGIETSDIVLISGGSSVGDKDYTYKILNEIGEILFKGIAVKPGKPTLLAKANDKLVLGLPGHPLACYLLYKILIADNLFKNEKRKTVFAKTSENFPTSPGKTSIVLVKLFAVDSLFYCSPIYTKSAYISTLAHANGYCLIDEKTEGIYKDSILEVHLL